MTRRLPALPTLIALLICFAGTLSLALLHGEEPLPSGEIMRAFLHPWLPFVPAPADEITATIVLDFRLPRVLLAALVGASLGLAGAALQGLLGNSLADPYTLGVSSGASVGAGTAMLLGVAGVWGGLGQPVCAFGAALVTLVLVLILARVGGRLHTGSFLLAGVVVGSLLWSITTLLLVLARQDQAGILRFLTGYFGDADKTKVLIVVPFVAAGLILFTVWGRALDALAFGDEVARSVGVELERFKWQVLLVSALMTAAAVSFAGVIGFVGLVVPHLGRGLVGPPHRRLMPVVALLGAILTTLADLLARAALPTFGRQEELPVGIVTALLGAPFFLILLRRQMGEGA